MNANDWVRQQLAAGRSPSEIERDLTTLLEQEATDWIRWGDGKWMMDTVCSICGSGFNDPTLHRDQPGREVILRSEYKRRKGAL